MRAGTWRRGWSRRRQLFFAVIGVLVLALAGVIGVKLAGGGSAPTGLPSQAAPGPVLLVPGYGGDADSLAPLAAKLRSAGRATVIIRLPGDGTGDLLAQVNTLDAAVDRALAAGAPSVDVIGYSAGGVVARLWVARDAGEHRVRRVVTLGSPLHGTGIAAAGSALLPGACPLACQQLVPDSPLLRGVDAQPLPAGLPWLSLWTADDQTVVPPDSARLPGAVNVPLQDICPSVQVSHSQLPGTPLVDGIVLAALNGPRVAAPTPDKCAALTAAGR
ncbi:MAG TPA: alpha/beta fold hydrolase [Pseudonocardiaceae bacterium]|nr:alpha/beta fold hydrolase [Pseudonocardiaceae bacterium]